VALSDRFHEMADYDFALQLKDEFPVLFNRLDQLVIFYNDVVVEIMDELYKFNEFSGLYEVYMRMYIPEEDDYYSSFMTNLHFLNQLHMISSCILLKWHETALTKNIKKVVLKSVHAWERAVSYGEKRLTLLREN
jgi:hypothetical protein